MQYIVLVLKNIFVDENFHILFKEIKMIRVANRVLTLSEPAAVAVKVK